MEIRVVDESTYLIALNLTWLYVKILIQSDDERDMNENSDEKFDFSYCYEYSEIHLSKTLEIRMNSIQMNDLDMFVSDRTGFNM